MRTEPPTIRTPFRRTISTTPDLAAMLELDEGELIDIAAQAASLYSTFRQPKKSGGFRVIRPPSKRLRVVQTRVLRVLEPRVRYPRWMMGGVPRRSILRHAQPHVGRMMVATLDLE